MQNSGKSSKKEKKEKKDTLPASKEKASNGEVSLPVKEEKKAVSFPPPVLVASTPPPSNKSKELEADFRKKMSYITGQLEDFYETTAELEQTLDLYELRILALARPVIVPRLGFLSSYDFERDDYLSVVSEGVLEVRSLNSRADLAGAKITLGDEEKSAKLDSEVFLPAYDEEELKEYLENGLLFLPVVEVRTIEEKEVPSDSEDDSSEEEED